MQVVYNSAWLKFRGKEDAEMELDWSRFNEPKLQKE